jgi:large subunit ribosomal protein L22
MKAILRNTRLSPKKANLVAGIVRGASVNDALAQLKFTPKKGAAILYKVIHSATANAENNFKQNRDKLYIKEIIVTPGSSFRRSRSISKGRMHPIKKRNAHITVYVDVMAPKAKAVKKVDSSSSKTTLANGK